MGIKQKVDELERRLKIAEKELLCVDYLRHYLRTLSETPDDAVLIYTIGGMRVTHSIGKSARVALKMIEQEMK